MIITPKVCCVVTMTSHQKKPGAHRLLQLSDEARRIATGLAQLSVRSTTLPSGEAEIGRARPEISAGQIDAVIYRRRQRAAYFPQDLLWDPAWDMMLHLLRAEVMQLRVSVSSLCGAAGVSATSALRWLKHLEQRDLVLRRADPLDRRRIFVELSDDGSSRLRQWFADSFSEVA